MGYKNIDQDLRTTATPTFAGLNVGNVALDKVVLSTTAGAPTYEEGTLFYDNVNKALGFYNDEADSVAQIPFESWCRVRNITGGLIANGSAVYLGPSDSSLPTALLAKADAASTSDKLYGLATHSIEDTSNGIIVSRGTLRGYDTQTPGWSSGEILWLSDSVAGGLTNVKPAIPNRAIRVGVVGVVDTTVGTIEVKIGTPQTQSAEEILFPNDGVATHADNLAEVIHHIWSAASLEGLDITDNLDGTVDIGAGDVVLRITDSHDSPLTVYHVNATAGVTPTDNDHTFICADYNSGSPIITTTSDPANIDGRTQVPLWLVTRVGAIVHTVDLRGYSTDAAYRYARQSFYTDGFKHVPGGSVATHVGTRNVDVTAGSFYIVGKEQTHGTFDTALIHAITGVNITTDTFTVAGDETANYTQGKKITVSGSTGNDGVYTVVSSTYTTSTEISVVEDITNATVDGSISYQTFTYIYKDGIGGWTREYGKTQISNTLYDDGDGTLGTLSNNKFGVHWVFVVLNQPSELMVMYGRGDYSSLAEAQSATVPTDLPPELAAYSTGQLIAKVMIEKSSSVFADIQSPFEVQLTSSTASLHNSLGGLQGGAAGLYYHSNQQINTTSSPTFANLYITNTLYGGTLVSDSLILQGTTYDDGFTTKASLVLTDNDFNLSSTSVVGGLGGTRIIGDGSATSIEYFDPTTKSIKVQASNTALISSISGTAVVTPITASLSDGLYKIDVSTNSALYITSASTIFNNDGASRDFIVEGDTDTFLVFVDASTDRVGIGTNIPSTKLDVVGGLKVSNVSGDDAGTLNVGTGTVTLGYSGIAGTNSLVLNSSSIEMELGTNPDSVMFADGTEIVFNDDAQDRDFRVESVSNAYMLFVDASTNRIGLGTNEPTHNLTLVGDFDLYDLDTGQVSRLTGRAGVGTSLSYQPATATSTSVDLNLDGNGAKLNISGSTWTNVSLDITNGDFNIDIGDTPFSALHATSTEIVINDDTQDRDFRVEGTTDINLVYVDASTNLVGIGKAPAPGFKLDVNGAIQASAIDLTGAGGLTLATGATVNEIEIELTSDDTHIPTSGAVNDQLLTKVTIVGTPVDNQIGVWTGDGTLEGHVNFTWDGGTLLVPGYISAQIGASINNIQSVLTDSDIAVPTSGAVVDYVTTAITGIVTKVGTPVDNQVAVWTGDGTLEGASSFTWSGTSLAVAGDIVLPKTSGKGIQVDTTTPTFPWRDIIGEITIKGGTNTPTWATFLTNISSYQFDQVNDEVWIIFHMPHDYLPGSELYIHAHWGLNIADTTNSITWGFDATFAKRNDTTIKPFPATTNKTVTHNCATVNVPQYGHIVSEVQLTDGSGRLGGVGVDNEIETDGLILVRTYLSADAGNIDPFLFTVDLHYQSTNIGTKSRAPDFWT